MELTGDDGCRLLMEPEGAGLLLAVDPVDRPPAALVLEREDVAQLVDMLGEWLVETEPDPDIPGRPV